jgi:uncharacterized protein (TIGR03067 family)
MLPNSLKLAALLAVVAVTITGAEALDLGPRDAGAQDDKKSAKPAGDTEAILGTWKVVAVEADGKDAADTEEGKEHTGLLLSFSREKAVAHKENDSIEFTYQLNSDAKPKTIDLEDEKDMVFNCLYSLDRDTLRICMPRKSGLKRPTELATKEGSECCLLILKREPKEKATGK